MTDDNPLKQVADTINSTAAAIAAVVALLSSDRTVVLEIDNGSGFPLRFRFGSEHHDHGGFGQTPPPTIADQQAGLFSSQSSGVATGTQGHVSYLIDAGAQLTVFWDVPFVDTNSSDATIEGVHRNRFLSETITGAGNHAQMRFVIAPRNSPYSVKEILGESGTDLSKGIRQSFFPASEPLPISLRKFLLI